MDFDCDQRESVHFFYTLPYSKSTALVETTWLSKMNDNSQKDYDKQIKNYIENHFTYTSSKIAESILNNWKKESLNFVKIMPTEYKIALEKMAKEKITEIIN